MPAQVVLLAGPSGSGKSRVARLSGCPQLALDDFYRDADHPGLPHTLGIVDWDDPATWDTEAAVAAIVELSTTGGTDLPTYDISASRRTGTHRSTWPVRRASWPRVCSRRRSSDGAGRWACSPTHSTSTAPAR